LNSVQFSSSQWVFTEVQAQQHKCLF